MKIHHLKAHLISYKMCISDKLSVIKNLLHSIWCIQTESDYNSTLNIFFTSQKNHFSIQKSPKNVKNHSILIIFEISLNSKKLWIVHFGNSKEKMTDKLKPGIHRLSRLFRTEMKTVEMADCLHAVGNRSWKIRDFESLLSSWKDFG